MKAISTLIQIPHCQPRSGARMQPTAQAVGGNGNTTQPQKGRKNVYDPNPAGMPDDFGWRSASALR
ncbi:MAG: hypothetical protein WBQ72_09550 [Terriglobales bacterium]